MKNYISIYRDHRGWPNLSDRCHASVMGSQRTKQCPREAMIAGNVRHNGESTWVPLCSQHSKAPNVTETSREELRKFWGIVDA